MHSRSKIPTGGIILIIIGVVFLLNNLNIMSIHTLIHNFWPVILILIGFYIIYNGMRGRGSHHHGNMEWDTTGFVDYNGVRVNESKSFGTLHLKVSGTPFEGGNIRTMFSEARVEIPKLELAKGENVLNVSASFSEMHMMIDRNIPVKIVASCTLGELVIMEQRRGGFNESIVYQSDNFDAADAKLVINCSMTLGELQVYHK